MTAKKAKVKARKPAIRRSVKTVAGTAQPGTRASRICALNVGESEAVATIVAADGKIRSKVEAAVKGHRSVMSKAAAVATARTKRKFVVDVSRGLTHTGDICVTCTVTRRK
jgi:hypothetical protein